MPGYPLVLISTDVFQEGEDLHTFCDRVMHYGLSGSPISIEQKIGRVDRVNSLAQRRLMNLDVEDAEKHFIQVSYPFVRESIEYLQVRSLCRNLNEFMATLHDFASNQAISDYNDTHRELTDYGDIPDKIDDFLESPFANTDECPDVKCRLAEILQEEKHKKAAHEYLNQAIRDVATTLPKVPDWDLVSARDGRHLLLRVREKGEPTHRYTLPDKRRLLKALKA